ncbi:MAG: ferrous iron transporter B [Planctomycetota bacterium]
MTANSVGQSDPASATARPHSVTVALVGRPNAGKTSLLMHLTGTQQRPVNFPGTSVERAEGRVRMGSATLRVVDLPGVVSLQAQSRDERVTVDYLRGDGEAQPDVLCAVLDAGKLVIELRLLQQLRQLGRPVVVALTKLDVAARAGMPVDTDALQRALGLPLCVVDGFRGKGAEELRTVLLATAGAAAAAVGDDAAAARVARAAPVDGARRTWTDRIDAVLLHKALGPLALGLVMLAMFQLVFAAAEPFVALVEDGQSLVADALRGLLPDGALQSFVVDGLVHGLGSVLVFVPQIALLIGLVAVLEGSGYMARAVFLLDRLLRKVGLTGRSFVPLTSSFACAIPGILASRIITDERDRLATIVTAPLMSCSARLPVYVVLLAAFFEPWAAGLLLFGLYLLGPVTAAGVALLLRKSVLRGGRSPLAMEMPVYQRPSLRVVWLQVWSAVRQFLVTAGTVILVATVVVWALGYFPRSAEVTARYDAAVAAVADGEGAEAQRDQLRARERAELLEQSWLATLGKAVQPVFAPAGFDWRHTVGVLAAFPARELVVPTLATLHSLGDVEADPEAPDPGLTAALRNATDARGRPTMNGLVALAMMAFFALCSQCAGTLAAIRRETHSWRWPLFTFGYMTVLAWAVAVGIYQIGSLLGYGLSG